MAGREFTIVVNPGEDMISIPHDDREVADLMLMPYEERVIDPGVWNDDVRQFRRCVERGLVTLRTSSQRPKEVPLAPSNMPEFPLHAHAVRQIVFSQSEDQALEYIQMQPRTGEDGGGELDVTYMKESFVPVLEAARDWLEEWSRPDRKRRLEAIKRRLGDIAQL